MHRVFLAATFATLVIVPAASAQQPGMARPPVPMSEEATMACKDDQAKFCGKVTPGEGRILKCLKSHDASLSAACKKALQGPAPGNDSDNDD